jgi:hypothetical protein
VTLTVYKLDFSSGRVPQNNIIVIALTEESAYEPEMRLKGKDEEEMNREAYWSI